MNDSFINLFINYLFCIKLTNIPCHKELKIYFKIKEHFIFLKRQFNHYFII